MKFLIDHWIELWIGGAFVCFCINYALHTGADNGEKR